MGRRMAHNLLVKGHDLTVYNRTPGKAEALIAEGAKGPAAPCLFRLWQQQDRGNEVRPLLFEVYNRFTEGFNTLDLKAVKSLLNEIS